MPTLRPYSFHVRHQATPDRALAVLDALARDLSPYTSDLPEEQLTRLRLVGVLARQSSRWHLTDTGVALHRLVQKRPALAAEGLHILHYCAWDPGLEERQRRELAFSWTYRRIVSLLYQRAPYSLDATGKRSLGAQIIGEIETDPYFSALPSTAFGRGISVDTTTVDGVLVWLRTLSPEVICDGVFARRSVCPPESMVLALAYVAQQAGAVPSVDFRLGREQRLLLGELTLLEPTQVDKMLDWAMTSFPTLLNRGTQTSSYGRQVVIKKLPIPLADVL